MRVALVVMPFAAADQPSLAVGLLKASLSRAGIECDVKHFHLTFWRLLGQDIYRKMAQDASMAALGGEWVFSQVLFGESFSDWQRYQAEVLDHPSWGVPQIGQRQAIQKALAEAPRFLRLAYESNDWGQYDLIGFTSTFEQTLASLCLAKEIKRHYPSVRIALGGANFEAGMGRPYMESFDLIDYISTGEADVSFPELCRRLAEKKGEDRDGIEVPPGFLYRQAGEIKSSGPARNGSRPPLDDLPIPDFDAYFRLARKMTRGEPRRSGSPSFPRLPVEASRGCWWGQKAHCTFCGLNGDTMAFRRKSWRRVAREIDHLVDRYGELPLHFADNILAMDYFQNLLPYWSQRQPKTPKFFEIKANLKRQQLKALKNAGIIKVQPGIESLADGTLSVMRKGVSAAQNVAMLRWSAEIGLQVAWNVIYGFPHEPDGDLESTLHVLTKLTHLAPPGALALIRLDRFSPNHSEWRQQGFSSISPSLAYRHLYPMPDESLDELAYYFHYRHPKLSSIAQRAKPLHAFSEQWYQHYGDGRAGSLAVKPHIGGGFVLSDSRFNHPRRTTMVDAVDQSLLVACDAPTTRAKALARAAEALKGFGKAELEARLDQLLATATVADVGGKLVTLALLPERLSANALRRAN